MCAGLRVPGETQVRLGVLWVVACKANRNEYQPSQHPTAPLPIVCSVYIHNVLHNHHDGHAPGSSHVSGLCVRTSDALSSPLDRYTQTRFDSAINPEANRAHDGVCKHITSHHCQGYRKNGKWMEGAAIIYPDMCYVQMDGKV